MADKLFSELNKGSWSSATSYTIGDFVSHIGSSYVCIANNTNQEPPNVTYWALLASGGGDVVGPASSTTDRVAVFDGTTGKLLKDGGETITEIKATSIPSSYLDTDGTLATNSDTKVASQKAVKTYVDGKVTSFWTSFSGAYNSASEIIISGVDVTDEYGFGTIIKWLSSADVFKLGMVVGKWMSGSDTILSVRGSVVASGDKTFKKCLLTVEKEVFIIAGTLSAGTNVSKTYFTGQADESELFYVIAGRLCAGTAGSTGDTYADVNIDGTTTFTTKLRLEDDEIAGAMVSSSSPTTLIVEGKEMTVDIDSTTTVPQVDGYVYVYKVPSTWVTRT